MEYFERDVKMSTTKFVKKNKSVKDLTRSKEGLLETNGHPRRPEKKVEFFEENDKLQ